MEHSSSKVERYLRYHPDSISDQNLLGQTPLHLAADWPWACKALLEAGADPSIPDFQSDFPLSYACFQDCLECVQILIAAGSPLSHGWSELSVLDRAFALVNNKRIHAALINELARRRQRLLTVSRRLLPRYIFEEITSSLKGLPDIEAFSLIGALLDAGDNADPDYWCYTCSSVYDAAEITVDIAELLFDAGFTDLEATDNDGLTLLLRSAMSIRRFFMLERIHSLAKVHWLLSKGVSLRRPVETKPLSEWLIPSANFVSAMLGVVMGYIEDREEGYSDIMNEILRQVLGFQYQNCHDLCKCHCSLQGCTPLVMFLKGLTTAMRRVYEIDEARSYRGQIIHLTVNLLTHHSTASEIIGMTKSALRFCLFEDLELRHVCCRPITRNGLGQDLLPPVEAEEARELQEEDKHRTQKFHDLLPKAEREYQQASGLFSDFWDRFYHDNIANSQEEEDPEITARSMVEIGVRIQEID